MDVAWFMAAVLILSALAIICGASSRRVEIVQTAGGDTVVTRRSGFGSGLGFGSAVDIVQSASGCVVKGNGSINTLRWED